MSAALFGIFPGLPPLPRHAPLVRRAKRLRRLEPVPFVRRERGRRAKHPPVVVGDTFGVWTVKGLRRDAHTNLHVDLACELGHVRKCRVDNLRMWSPACRACQSVGLP